MIGTSDWVFYDLETTGFGSYNDVEILQLSAVCGDEIYNSYVDPSENCKIDPRASEVTELRMQNCRLTYKNQPVQSKPMKDVLREFIGWLGKFKRPIIMGHNSKRYDNPLLYREMEKNGFLPDFKGVIGGFIDTFELFKSAMPGRQGKGMYKQETLVREFLGVTYDAHNSVEDVKVLQRLVQHMNFDPSIVHKMSFDMDYVEKKSKERKRKETLKPLVKDNLLTKTMVDKVAESGLEWGHLVEAVQADPAGGIRQLFTWPTGHGARVTNLEGIIEAVTTYFQKYLAQLGEH